MSAARELFQAIHRIGTPDPSKCHECGCIWHGLACEKAGCICKTSFVDKYAEGESA